MRENGHATVCGFIIGSISRRDRALLEGCDECKLTRQFRCSTLIFCACVDVIQHVSCKHHKSKCFVFFALAWRMLLFQILNTRAPIWNPGMARSLPHKPQPQLFAGQVEPLNWIRREIFTGRRNIVLERKHGWPLHLGIVVSPMIKLQFWLFVPPCVMVPPTSMFFSCGCSNATAGAFGGETCEEATRSTWQSLCLKKMRSLASAIDS